MSALVLKIIACVAMVIDHAGCSLVAAQVVSSSSSIYLLMRIIGRIAFPIYGFLLVEGARYTKSKVKYFLRLLLFAFISEVPFDLTILGWFWDMRAQNVFFTLAIGLLGVYSMMAGSQAGQKHRAIRFGLGVFMAFVLVFIAKLLRTDYDKAGVWMIAIMGVLACDFSDIRWLQSVQKAIPALYDQRVRNFIFAALGILVCSAYFGYLEWYSLFALIPILLYNGKRGYSNKRLQWFFYAYYPLHLLILALIFVIPYLF